MYFLCGNNIFITDRYAQYVKEVGGKQTDVFVVDQSFLAKKPRSIRDSFGIWYYTQFRLNENVFNSEQEAKNKRIQHLKKRIEKYLLQFINMKRNVEDMMKTIEVEEL